MDLCNEKDIRALLGRHGFRFSKSMGQNFLIEGWVPRDIAEASGAGPDTGVLEIGPGIGPLTVQLARRAAKVAAIELDRTLYPILAETLAPYPNAEVVPGDAMKLDLAALVSDKFSGLTAIACANLPYNITTPVLTALIEAGCFASITVMIQREVALRICAAPGSSDYGAFSVFCQYHTQPELLFEVGPECFLPAPKVTSAVIRLVPAPPLLRIWWTTAFLPGGQSLLRPAAQDAPQRPLLRLRQPPVQRRAAGAIEAAGLPADIRGERLGIPEFATLASALQNRL
ncbi:MAG: 16S rRNA (adenine(1518)-N(6)/adenine(1519)-N(6))-dimethyltransferase RsmA [Flavonifractor plautii]